MISVVPALQHAVTLGVLDAGGCRVLDRDDRLDAPIEAALARVRAQPEAGEASFQDVRAMYRRLGLDPTKTRPSSEALLRRVRKGGAWPRVNSLVDICNWCSLELQLPYGLYDREQIQGEMELRVGREGEEYAGIRKDAIHLAGRPTLADAQGPFGNPSSDSRRTMVTTATRRALVVIFAPHGIDRGQLERALDLTASRIAEFTGGREIARGVVSSM